jgi:hypothetical protein
MRERKGWRKKIKGKKGIKEGKKECDGVISNYINRPHVFVSDININILVKIDINAS